MLQAHADDIAIASNAQELCRALEILSLQEGLQEGVMLAFAIRFCCAQARFVCNILCKQSCCPSDFVRKFIKDDAYS